MLKEALQTLAGMVNAETEVESEYPAWQYKADSKLRGIMEDTYEEVFGKKTRSNRDSRWFEMWIFPE